MKVRNNLVKNTIMLTIGTVLNKGLVFLMIPLFSKWLSTEDYGTFDLMCTYTVMLIPILSLATGDGIFRIGIDSKDKNKVITNGLFIYIMGAILFGIITILGIVIFHKSLLFPFYVLFLGEFFNKYLQSFLRSIKRLDIFSFSSIISTTFIFALVTVLLKLFDFGIYGIIYGYALGYLIGNIVIVLYGKLNKYLEFKISLSTIKELIVYSLPLIPNSISWWIVNASDRSIINIYLGLTYNGIYAIAHKIPNLCSSIFSVFSVAWQEAAIDTKDSKERNKYYESVYNNMFVIIVSLCCGIISLNYFLFNYVFDLKYSSGRLYVPILVISVIFSTISQFLGGIQICLKQQKSNGVTTIIGAVVNILVHLLLINAIGLYAAAISTLVSNIVIVVLRKIILKKDVDIKLNRKSLLLSLIFSLFIISAYIGNNFGLVYNVLILFISGCTFIAFNKNIFHNLVRKIIKK